MKVNILSTDNRYQIVYADPPWPYNDQYDYGDYKSMSIEDIAKLPIKMITLPDSMLFLWITYPMLKDGLYIMESWGFEYRTIAFQWVKLNRNSMGAFYGLGNWTRGNSEGCFLGIKGNPCKVHEGVFQLVMTPIQRHSKKPNEVRDRIVQLAGDLPRIELFARQQVEGWDCWGNEV